MLNNWFVYLILALAYVALLYFLLYGRHRSKDTYDRYADPKLDELRDRLAIAIPEIRNISLYGSNKSFTINKQHVYICMKDENGKYYDENMLIYVLLHELAHVLCDEVGHTEKYSKIFRSLLHRAHEAGLYDPNQPPLDNYCNY
jgi:predicted metal-dependent hydrolase